MLRSELIAYHLTFYQYARSIKISTFFSLHNNEILYINFLHPCIENTNYQLVIFKCYFSQIISQIEI